MQKYSPCGRYELTGEKKTVDGVVVRRYKVRDDISMYRLHNGLNVGMILGHISGWSDITDDGVVLYHGTAIDSYIGGSSRVSGTVIGSHVSGNSVVNKDAVVRNSCIYDDVILCEDVVVNNVVIRGDVCVDEGAVIDSKESFDIIYSGLIPSDAEITKPEHCKAMTVYTSHSLDTLLYRTKSGKPKVIMGCWRGSIDKLEKLLMKDKWVETRGDDCKRLRPQMLALVKYFREIVATW